MEKLFFNKGLVGWLKRLMAVATVPGHNLHRQISGSAPKTSSQTLPASFWWSAYQKRKPSEEEGGVEEERDNFHPQNRLKNQTRLTKQHQVEGPYTAQRKSTDNSHKAKRQRQQHAKTTEQACERKRAKQQKETKEQKTKPSQRAEAGKGY